MENGYINYEIFVRNLAFDMIDQADFASLHRGLLSTTQVRGSRATCTWTMATIDNTFLLWCLAGMPAGFLHRRCDSKLLLSLAKGGGKRYSNMTRAMTTLLLVGVLPTLHDALLFGHGSDLLSVFSCVFGKEQMRSNPVSLAQTLWHMRHKYPSVPLLDHPSWISWIY